MRDNDMERKPGMFNSAMDLIGENIGISGGMAKKVLLGFVILFAAWTAVYTIKSGTVGVLATAGKFSKNEVLPGLHFKIPFLQTVYTVDTKMHTVNYMTTADLPDSEGIINKPYIRVLDQKNLPIGIELSVQYRPISSEGSEILSGYGKSYFDKAINPVIRDIVRDVVGKYEAEKIAIDRTTIAGEFKTRMDDRFKKLPFLIGEVSLRDIKLPGVVNKKIEEVQIAKQEEQKLAMVERQVEKRQKIKTIEAQTNLIEVTTRAKAEAAKVKLEADAKAYRITKEAEARAKANREISESLTSLLVRYNSVNRWDGKYPTTYMGGETGGIILDIGQKGNTLNSTEEK